MDFLIQKEPTDPSFGDIVWNNGPLTKEYTTQSRTEVVAQRLFILLRTFEEEWFLNEAYGIPYWQSILGLKTPKSRVDLIFQQKILSENGVAELTFFESTFVNRRYSLRFAVRVTTGEETDIITIN